MKNLPLVRLGLGLAVFGLALTVYAGATAPEWKVPAWRARRKNPVPATAESIAAGKVVYTKNCFACHGALGKGDGPAARDLDVKPRDLSSPEVQKQSDGALFYMITEGRKPMPSFAQSLTETQRWQVVNFIRTLAAKPDKK